MIDMMDESDVEEIADSNVTVAKTNRKQVEEDDNEDSDNEDTEMMEEQYNLNQHENSDYQKEKVPLLPIKTKAGIVPREQDKEEEKVKIAEEVVEDEIEVEADENMDSDNDILEEVSLFIHNTRNLT
jgi:hypothetical protein